MHCRLNLFLAAGILASPSFGQEILAVYDGTFILFNISPAPDMDGDGVPDLLLGSASNVKLVSSETGLELAVYDPETPSIGLGVAMDEIGDFDGDGVSDFAISAPYAGLPPDYPTGINYGYVRVYSGVTGTPIAEMNGSMFEARLGMHISAAGDVDGDGYADVLAAWWSSRVRVFGGPDGHLIRTHQQPSLRPSVAGIGDVDGDGNDDYAIGWPQSAGNRGEVVVFSGCDGTELYRVMGTLGDVDQSTPGDRLGYSVTGLGDVDGDGVGDFAAGAPQLLPGFDQQGRGYVRVYSGADGSELYELESLAPAWHPYARFGQAVDGGLDVDGDGVGDLVVGAPREVALGSTNVFSGRTGHMLWHVMGPALQSTGDYVRILPDLDGDGLAEFADIDPFFGSSDGRITVFRGAPSDCTEVCAGAPNSTGAGAGLAPHGPVSVGNDELALVATNLPALQFALLVYGDPASGVPFGDGELCVGGAIHRVGAPVATTTGAPLEIPLAFSQPPAGSGPGQIAPGDRRVLQVWYRDPGAGGAGSNLSSALSIVFTP